MTRELAGRASARLLPALGIRASRDTALRALLRIPLPALQVPRVLGIDDFALRRGLVYATVLIDAETGRRLTSSPAAPPTSPRSWLREHPGVEVVCRTGPGPTARPPAGPCRRRCRSVTAGTCGTASARPSGRRSRRTAPAGRRARPLQEGKRAETTLERWQQVHDLRGKGAGLLDCSRRLGLSLNTVKRYDRASEPERLQRVPKYRPTLVDPYRDYLRKRRAEEPGVPVQQLLREIRERGYQGSSNLLVRYINQGRLDSEPAAPVTPPGRPAPAHQARPPDRRPAGDSSRARGRLPRDDRPGQPDPLLRGPARPGPGQRGQAPGVDHRRPRRRPAPRARLHPRPRPGHPGRHRGAHPAASTTAAPRESTPRRFCGIRNVKSALLGLGGHRGSGGWWRWLEGRVAGASARPAWGCRRAGPAAGRGRRCRRRRRPARPR